MLWGHWGEPPAFGTDIQARNLFDKEECQSYTAVVNFTRIYPLKDEKYCILFKDPVCTAQ
jgi:hypothetical protein